jgi:ArsR family transcriptional regulator
MDSAALLDLLGNRNRRRILRLLARKPCYVTEISEYLGVSPKAVIDHLRKLEDAGLIESRVDDQRRKYFHIARNVRLEVNVSPYAFGTKSAYAASKSLDVSRWRHLTLDVEVDEDQELGELADELRDLEELQSELSMAQRWVQGRMTDLLDSITDHVEADHGIDNRLYADLLRELSGRTRTVDELVASLEVPPEVVETALTTLRDAGIVEEERSGWTLSP